MYLIADKDHAAGLAPVISAFVTELTQAANIAPLPQLPDLMSHAGGSGIFTTVVLQSTAQARARWGTDGAAMLLGSGPAGRPASQLATPRLSGADPPSPATVPAG